MNVRANFNSAPRLYIWLERNRGIFNDKCGRVNKVFVLALHHGMYVYS